MRSFGQLLAETSEVQEPPAVKGAGAGLAEFFRNLGTLRVRAWNTGTTHIVVIMI